MDKTLTRLPRQYRAIKTAANNLTVTLPRAWVIANKIEQGQALNLFMDGNVLVIQKEIQS